MCPYFPDSRREPDDLFVKLATQPILLPRKPPRRKLTEGNGRTLANTADRKKTLEQAVP